MNNFLHTFLSPFLYFDLFGTGGYICIALMIILIISTTTLKGTTFFISTSVLIIGIVFLFVYSGLPIAPKDEKTLREQMNYFAIEVIEDADLKQEKQRIIKDFQAIIDKGYINQLEEADTYKKLVEFNHQQLDKKYAKYLDRVQHEVDQTAQY